MNLSPDVIRLATGDDDGPEWLRRKIVRLVKRELGRDVALIICLSGQYELHVHGAAATRNQAEVAALRRALIKAGRYLENQLDRARQLRFGRLGSPFAPKAADGWAGYMMRHDNLPAARHWLGERCWTMTRSARTPAKQLYAEARRKTREEKQDNEHRT